MFFHLTDPKVSVYNDVNSNRRKYFSGKFCRKMDYSIREIKTADFETAQKHSSTLCKFSIPKLSLFERQLNIVRAGELPEITSD
jgi:hypothetical protein